MKTILTLSLAILTLWGLTAPSSLQAADYYFSSSIGDDSRTASQAQNPNTPWKTINKLNSVMSSIQPGDNILFRRGDTFHGTITLSKAGSPGNPIRFGAYGSGNAPIITSLVTLSNWSSRGNGVFDTSIPDIRSSAVNIVLINNRMQEMGRFPNSDAPNRGYLTYETVSGSNTIGSQSLGSSPNWTGGEIVIRKIFWITDRHRITSHSGNSVTFANNPETSYAPRANYGFFIQNHPQTLDKFGEWYFNPSTKQISIFFGSVQPSNARVEVATHDQLVNNTTSVRDVVFENIHFRGANRDLIFISTGNNLNIQNCTFEYAGENGITLNETGNSRMVNSRVSHANNNGIDLRFSQNFTLTNNTVENVYLIPGHGLSGDNKGIGIFAAGHNARVERNTLKNLGYIGIRFGGNNTVVHENYIDQFCLTKNDGGGIYSYSQRNLKNTGRKVTNNVILNGVGVIEGTNGSFFSSLPQAEGIYLDDNVTGVEVIGNTVGHMTAKGIYLHNTENIVVRGNTIFDSNDLIFLRNDNMGNPLINNLIEQNHLLIDNPFHQYVNIYTIYGPDDVEKMAVFNNNFFSSPFYDDYRFRVRYNAGTTSEVNQVFNINTWRSTYRKDQNSSVLSKKINLFTTKSTIGQTKVQNGQFNSNTTGYFCQNCTITWTNNAQLNGGSARVDTRRNTQFSTVSGPLTRNKTYRVKFTARGNKTHSLSIFLRQAGAPWLPISASQTVEIGSVKRDYELFIQPNQTVENSRVMFTSVDPSDFHFFIDDIEVFEVDVDEKKPSDYVLFEYNTTGQTTSIPLAGDFIDLRNTVYSGSFQLNPFSSALLIKNSSGTIDQIEKPTVSLSVQQNTSSWVEGNNIQLSVSSNTAHSNILRVEYFNNGTRVGVSEQAPFAFTWTNIPSGTHNLTAKLTDRANQFAESEPVRVNVLQKASESASGFSLYLNSGSTQSATVSGINFIGENSSQVFHQNSRTFSITDSNLDPLFTTERFGATLSYSIPIPNGTYVVRTLHNELWFGRSGPPAAAGRRVFDILIEGRTVKSSFDIFVENGNKPTILTFTNIEVTDGILNLNFRAISDNPSISGIAIDHINNTLPTLTPSLNGVVDSPVQRPTINPIYLNTGSSSDVLYQEVLYKGDGTLGFHSSSRVGGNSLINVPDLFKTERFAGTLNYTIPVPNGTYTVATHHNELWFGLSGPSAAPGRRVFNISLEGKTVKENLDLFTENGNRPLSLVFENVIVQDGFINLSLVGIIENATISGLSIMPAGIDYSRYLPPTPSVEPIFINVGSFSNTQYQGIDFNGDTNLEYFDLRSQTTINNSASAIELFRTERFQASLRYTIPVPNGTYDVFTFHNELWFGHRGPSSAPGRRVFDIYLEDKLVKSNFDMFVENGNRETTLKFADVNIADGVLNLEMVASQNNATLSGIAIIPKDQGGNYNLRTIGHESFVFDGILENNRMRQNAEFTLFPNPASHSAVLEISENLMIKGVGIYSTNGQLIKFVSPANGSENTKTFIIPLEDVRDGVYILSVHTGNDHVEKLRLIVRH